MAVINLASLSKKAPVNGTPFTYSDLELDMTLTNTQSYPAESTLKRKDVVADYDLGAIKNSIVNLFTTIPGEKLLNPEYGLNLNQYLFEPCDENTAQSMADAIFSQVSYFEPRVEVDRIEVNAKMDKQEFEITLGLRVPFLNNVRTLNVRGLLNSTGIQFYN